MEVRTKSIPTTAVLILLGHTPIGVRKDNYGGPVVRFAPSAEPDLLRLLDAKKQAEQIIGSAQ